MSLTPLTGVANNRRRRPLGDIRSFCGGKGKKRNEKRYKSFAVQQQRQQTNSTWESEQVNNNQILSRRRVVHQETAWEIRPKGAKLQKFKFVLFAFFLKRRETVFWLFLLSGGKKGRQTLEHAWMSSSSYLFLRFFYKHISNRRFAPFFSSSSSSFLHSKNHSRRWLALPRHVDKSKDLPPPSIFFFPFFQSNLFNPDEITKFFPFDIFFLFIKATGKSQFNSRKRKI